MATEFPRNSLLPFVACDAAGEGVDWLPVRHPESPSAGVAAGLAYAQALAALARDCEFEAWRAALRALLSPEWRGDAAEEAGFVEGLVRAAVVGWRAMACEETLPFGTRFDPAQAEWLALHERVALLETQLRDLNQQPWRSHSEAPTTASPARR